MEKHRIKCRILCSASQKKWLSEQLHSMQQNLFEVLIKTQKRQQVIMNHRKFQDLTIDEQREYLQKRRMRLEANARRYPNRLFKASF